MEASKMNEGTVESETLQTIKAKHFKRAAWNTGVIGAAALFFFLVNLGSDDTPIAPFVILFLLALAFNVEEYFSYLKAKKRAARAASDSAASRQAGVEAVSAAEPRDTDLTFLRQTIDLAADARNRG